ncbi:hypothetical protein [Amycolatopsis sp. NPDC004079]|uniref:hypothetical protein n=1 Tax=Amycolatopsis sp. NPDC004079 TaxID=3154549 RepID=UPI0033BC6022
MTSSTVDLTVAIGRPVNVMALLHERDRLLGTPDDECFLPVWQRGWRGPEPWDGAPLKRRRS